MSTAAATTPAIRTRYLRAIAAEADPTVHALPTTNFGTVYRIVNELRAEGLVAEGFVAGRFALTDAGWDVVLAR